MCSKTFLCIVSFARLALRRLVDDYEHVDVSVSFFTVQLRCTFNHFRIFSLTLKQFLLEVESSNRSPGARKSS